MSGFDHRDRYDEDSLSEPLPGAREASEAEGPSSPAVGRDAGSQRSAPLPPLLHRVELRVRRERRRTQSHEGSRQNHTVDHAQNQPWKLSTP